jgi:hypothetical protein
MKHCAANRKRRLSALPNVDPYIYDVKISGFTMSSIKNQKTRVGGPYNKNGGRENPKKGFKWNLPQYKTSGKTKNQMGRCGSGGCIAAARSKRMEEKS